MLILPSNNIGLQFQSGMQGWYRWQHDQVIQRLAEILERLEANRPITKPRVYRFNQSGRARSALH